MEITNTDALIIIDPQNDFVPKEAQDMKGGALAVPGGHQIMDDISFLSLTLFARGALIATTQDYHPRKHKSFATTHYLEPYAEIDMPYGAQTLWPDHCVQGSYGARFHANVEGAVALSSIIIRKGMNPDVDSYSAFVENDQKTSTGLAAYLRAKGIKRCLFVGLAYDFCVGFSALDAVKEGFDAVVIKDLTRSIALPVKGGTTETAMDKQLADAGVVTISHKDFYPSHATA